MSQLHVVKPDWRPRLTLDDVLVPLHPDRFDEIEAKVRVMRESFTAPVKVADSEGFKRVLLQFQSHHVLWLRGAPLQRADGNTDLQKSEAIDFAETHMKNYSGGLTSAERNAITGRAGGMIGVIDAITDGLVKFHVDAYIKAVFRKLLALSDFETRCWIVEQVMRRYGGELFPDEELKRPEQWAGQMEEFVTSFVMHIHALRGQWRA
jgi:hypothetical protein